MNESSQWICIALLFGVAIGSATNHLGLCMILSLSIGVIIGLIKSQSGTNDKTKNNRNK